MVDKTKKTHVSEGKKSTVKLLGELLSKKTVMVVSVKNLPSSQFQEIKNARPQSLRSLQSS
jgi:ribosomal protein L10